MNLMLGNWDTKLVPLGCDERTVQERVGACGVSIQKGLDSRLVELSRYPIRYLYAHSRKRPAVPCSGNSRLRHKPSRNLDTHLESSIVRISSPRHALLTPHGAGCVACADAPGAMR